MDEGGASSAWREDISARTEASEGLLHKLVWGFRRFTAVTNYILLPLGLFWGGED